MAGFGRLGATFLQVCLESGFFVALQFLQGAFVLMLENAVDDFIVSIDDRLFFDLDAGGVGFCQIVVGDGVDQRELAIGEFILVGTAQRTLVTLAPFVFVGCVIGGFNLFVTAFDFNFELFGGERGLVSASSFLLEFSLDVLANLLVNVFDRLPVGAPAGETAVHGLIDGDAVRLVGVAFHQSLGTGVVVLGFTTTCQFLFDIVVELQSILFKVELLDLVALGCAFAAQRIHNGFLVGAPAGETAVHSLAQSCDIGQSPTTREQCFGAGALGAPKLGVDVGIEILVITAATGGKGVELARG